MPSIGQKYDSIARQFASIRTKELTEKKYLDLLVQQLNQQAPVLDIGCGMGEPITTYLAELKYAVTGLDVSKELLSMAKKKLPDAKFIFGDMRIVQIDEKFDALIAWDCLSYLPYEDQKHILPRLHSWLNASGKLLFTTADASNVLEVEILGETFSHYHFSPDEYQKLLQSAGFEILLQEQAEEHQLVWLVQPA